jgi:hypothetical protein
MDRLAAEFERHGFPTVRQNLRRDGRMGRMVRHGSAEICFAIEDDDETVCVTDYRQVEPPNGFRQGFGTIVWFVEFIVARPELRLRRLHGMIRPDRKQHALSAERLAAGYRLLGGRLERTVNGEDWFAIEFAEYRNFHRRRTDARTKAVCHG